MYLLFKFERAVSAQEAVSGALLPKLFTQGAIKVIRRRGSTMLCI